MAYISRENLFPEVTWYGNRMDTGKDWNCIDKILPYPIVTANGTDDGVTHSDWMARADERTAVLDRKHWMCHDINTGVNNQINSFKFHKVKNLLWVKPLYQEWSGPEEHRVCPSLFRHRAVSRGRCFHTLDMFPSEGDGERLTTNHTHTFYPLPN